MKWEAWELKFIDMAVTAINSGDSIYSWVLLLRSDDLYHRTSASIRSKIGRGLKRGTTFSRSLNNG